MRKVTSLNPYGYTKPGVLTKVKNFLFKGWRAEKEQRVRGKALDFSPNMGMFPANKLGIKKTDSGAISFEELRRISDYDSVINICVNIIKKGVSQSPYAIIKRDNVDKIDKGQQKAAEQFFQFINSEDENLRQFLARIVEDILVLDAGVGELIKNAKGEIVSLDSIDGATLRQNRNKYGEFGNPAYLQFIDELEVAQFNKDEIMYVMLNPQNNVKRFPYGRSVIEGILLSIDAAFKAELYNDSIFSEDNIPPGIVNLGNVREDEAEAVRMMWDAEESHHKLKFLYGAEKVDFFQFRRTNKDMQFAEYLDWLNRIKISAFGLTAMDLNFVQDVNRSTSESMGRLSRARGVQSIKRVLEESFYKSIFMPMGWDTVNFKFEVAQDLEERRTQAEIDKIYVETGIYTINEIRAREGHLPLDEITSEDLRIQPEEESSTQKSKYPLIYA